VPLGTLSKGGGVRTVMDNMHLRTNGLNPQSNLDLICTIENLKIEDLCFKENNTISNHIVNEQASYLALLQFSPTKFMNINVGGPSEIAY
jgi:hypothetical protein